MRTILIIALSGILMPLMAKEPKVSVTPMAPVVSSQDIWPQVSYADRVIAPEATPEVILKSIAAHIVATDYVAVERAIAALIKAGKPEVIASAIAAMIQADQALALEHTIKTLIAAIEADKSGEVAKVVRKVFNRWDATEGFPEASHIAALTYVGRLKERHGKTDEADKIWNKLLRLLKED